MLEIHAQAFCCVLARFVGVGVDPVAGLGDGGDHIAYGLWIFAGELAVDAIGRHAAQAPVQVVIAPQAQQLRVGFGTAGMRRVDDGQIHVLAEHGLLVLVVGHHQKIDLTHIRAMLAEIGLGDELRAGAKAVEANGLAFQIFGRADGGVLAHEVLHVRRFLQRLAAGGNHLHVGTGGNRRNHQRHHAGAEVNIARADQRNDLGRGNLAYVVGAGGGAVEVTQAIGQIDQVERRVVRVIERHDLAAVLGQLVCGRGLAAGRIVRAGAGCEAQGS